MAKRDKTKIELSSVSSTKNSKNRKLAAKKSTDTTTDNTVDEQNNKATKNNDVADKNNVADKVVSYTIDMETGDVEVRMSDETNNESADKVEDSSSETETSSQSNDEVETSNDEAVKGKDKHKKDKGSQTTVKPNKKKKLMRRLITFGIIIVLGVVSGAFLADWYKNYLKSQIADYTSYAITDYIDDTRAIVAKATGIDNPSDDDLNNFASLAKQHGQTPQNYTPSENYALAYFKASLATSYSAIGTGQISTPVANQSVYSAKKFDGSKYTFESVSLGMLTVAKCIVSNSGSDKVTVIDGNNANTSGATWNGNSVDYTEDEFKELAGVLPSELMPYIISSKTILNEDQVEITKTDFSGKEVYKFTVELNNVYSVLNYHKQVKFSSGFSDSPSFSNIKITFLMDDEWNFVQTQIEEKYTVIFGISVQCTGTLVTDYTFNEQVEMPI